MARPCSECGTGYRPSDYDFKCGKVRFACPQCATGYYGTSARGHLEPIAFECPTCRKFIHMDECVLEPVGLDDDQGAMRVSGIPWVEPGGVFARWGRTVAIGISEPNTVHVRVGSKPNAWRALWFLVIQSWIAALPTVCCCGVVGAVSTLPPTGPGAVTESLVAMAIIIAVTPVVFAVHAGSAAVFVRLVPHPSRSGSSSEGVRVQPPTLLGDFAIVCYTSGPLVATAIPLYGTPVLIWWLVAAAIGLTSARPNSSRLSVVIATVAGFLLPGLAALALALTLA